MKKRKEKERLYFAGTCRDVWLTRSPEYRSAFKIEILEKKQNGVCNKCKRYFPQGELSIDHIVPICRGGPVDDPNNMQVLCLKCHNRKTRSEYLLNP